MTYPRHACIQWSTSDVAVSDRIDYWNEKNTSVLVGLRSSTFDDDGLQAAQTNFDLGGLRLADIRGNRHVIERNGEMVRRHPKPAVFASLVLESKGFFYQGSDCHMLEPGDLVLYDIQRPYAIGFTDSMRQLLFDLPADVFDGQISADALARPVKVDARHGAGRVLALRLRQRALDFIARPNHGDTQALQDEVRAALQTMVADHLAGQSGAGLSASYLVAARAHIARHLHQIDLDVQSVAGALGITPRHLSRLFAAQGLTPAGYIRACRVQGAHGDLSNPALVKISIAAIAYKWGFVSQAHFSRVFREHFGLAPKDIRDAGLNQ